MKCSSADSGRESAHLSYEEKTYKHCTARHFDCAVSVVSNGTSQYGSGPGIGGKPESNLRFARERDGIFGYEYKG